MMAWAGLAGSTFERDGQMGVMVSGVGFCGGALLPGLANVSGGLTPCWGLLTWLWPLGREEAK